MAHDIDSGRYGVVSEGIAPPTIQRRITMLSLTLEVAERRGISLADMMGRNRRRPISCARHEVFYLAHKVYRMSLPMVGRFFNYDHTTILHGVRAHERRIAA